MTLSLNLGIDVSRSAFVEYGIRYIFLFASKARSGAVRILNKDHNYSPTTSLARMTDN